VAAYAGAGAGPIADEAGTDGAADAGVEAEAVTAATVAARRASKDAEMREALRWATVARSDEVASAMPETILVISGSLHVV